MARRVDEAQNRVLAMAIDRDDAAISPARRGRQAVRQHAFVGETGPNARPLRVVADCGDEANFSAATRGGDRLVALHSDFDWLIIGRNQVWKIGRIDGESDGSRDAWLSCDEAGLFER